MAATEVQLRSYLKRAAHELRETRQRLRSVEARHREPLAITGIACRTPGGVTSPEGLWELLVSERDAVVPFPRDRNWNLDSLFHPDPDHPGTTYVQEAGFLDDAGHFDADLFGIGPREAEAMCPQHRQVLETSWELLERAGIAPMSLKGSDTGVFIGATNTGYETVGSHLEGYGITGSVTSVISGRVAYTLGLQGPAVTVDTACSSSLVALHLAGQALRNGDCSAAIVGGVAVMALAEAYVEFSRQRGLAGDGRCKPFAKAADGTNWAEGVGLLLVEPLSDARRKGRRILAVIRGSAVNQDGASSGLTAPSGPAQERVIAAALAEAGLRSDDIDAIEAHGTATALGDPIEGRALMAAFADRAPALPKLQLGSLKSNIGHTTAAAGALGLIKMVLGMRHGVLPKTLHMDEPNPAVDWASGPVELLTEARPWPSGDRPRRAGVSAFGISGTNAHVILEEPPAPADGGDAEKSRSGERSNSGENFGSGESSKDAVAAERPAEPSAAPALSAAPASSAAPAPRPWLLSSATAAGLRAQAERLHDHLSTVERDAPEAPGPLDIGYALATTRSPLRHRAAFVPSTRADALRTLAQLAEGAERPPGVLRAAAGPPDDRLAVLFSGQGAQRAGMGEELAAAFPAFAEHYAAVCRELDRHLDRPLRRVVAAGSGPSGPGAGHLHRTEYAQAALFALETALFRLMESWGLRTDFVGGHSIGEITAAHVAGVLSLGDAARLVAARGRLMQDLPPGGAMAAVQATEEEAASVLAAASAPLSVAAVNGPTSLVLSGAEEAVDEAVARFAALGRRTKRLTVSHAFHSALMEPMLESFLTVARGMSWAPPRIPLLSNLTGRTVTADEVCAPEYWVRHVREAVRFHDGVTFLAAQGVRCFVELGPGAELSAAVEECLTDLPGAAASANRTVIPALRKGQDEPKALMRALSALYTNGTPLEWSAVFAGTGAQPVELPTYAFQHKRYWADVLRGQEAAPAAGTRAPDRTDTAFWDAVERGDAAELARITGADARPLAETLPALAAWRRRRRERELTDDWRYRITWEQAAPPAGTSAGTGTWLLVAPPLTDPHFRALADELTDALTGPDGHTTVVRWELDGTVTDPDHTDGTGAAHLARRLDALTTGAETSASPPAGGHGELAGVVSLLALDERPHLRHAAVTAGMAATLTLVRALTQARRPARLWAVTGGAVSTDGEPLPHPRQTQVWGLGRAVALEQPGIWGGLVDLPEHPAAADVRQLAANLSRDDDEDQLALRSGRILARRLNRYAGEDERDGGPELVAWRPHGTVLITGGTGGIGAAVARWAAGNGAARLVLTSRRGPHAPGAAELEADLSALGAKTTVLSCDMTDRDAVAAAVAEATGTSEPLTAVLHAAGTGQFGDLTATGLDEYARIVSGKVLGAAYLDELLDGTEATGTSELEVFALFSSVSAVWGGGKQAAYAAGNAYLDGLAQRRRAEGKPATSVAWGPWGEIGMASDKDAAAFMRQLGLPRLDPGLAVTALAHALGGGETCPVLADVDWATFLPGFTALRSSPLLAPLATAHEAAAATEPPATSVRPVLADRLARLPAAERTAAARTDLRTEVADVLGHGDPAAIEDDRSFTDLGFDSMAAVNLRNRLRDLTGLDLPATLIYEHPTITELAGHLIGALHPAGAAQDPTDGPPTSGADDRGADITSMDPASLIRLALDGRKG